MVSKLMYLICICLNFAKFGVTEKTVCYFESWSVLRPCYGSFDVEDIDPFLCTDLIYAFAGINNETWEIEVLDPWNDNCADQDPPGANCAFDRFVALKDQNSALTITLSVGGSNERSADFSQMAADSLKRQIFVNSSVALLVEHKFDGLDLAWEYPTQRGGVPDDRETYVLLVRDLREAFDKFDPPLQLTAVMSCEKDVIDQAYDIMGLAVSLDFFHLFSFDYHGPWENNTHHHAPLCGYANDTGVDIYKRVDYAVDHFIDLGAPPEKIIMGIAMYGRCWNLDDPDNNGMRAPAHSPSPAGQYTAETGIYAYNEICERLISHVCTVVFDINLEEPYFYCSDNVWCGYDDADSVYFKARFAKNRRIAGVLVWSIDQEDFRPVCSPQANHHITNIKNALAAPPDDVPFECPPLGWG